MDTVECIDPRTGCPYCRDVDCCSDKFFVVLTKEDEKRLSSMFDLKKITTTISDVTTLRQENGRCIFFDHETRLCIIHEKKTPDGQLIKPIECRLFPLVWKDGSFCINESCEGKRVRADTKTETWTRNLFQQYESELEDL